MSPLTLKELSRLLRALNRGEEAVLPRVYTKALELGAEGGFVVITALLHDVIEVADLADRLSSMGKRLLVITPSKP